MSEPSWHLGATTDEQDDELLEAICDGCRPCQEQRGPDWEEGRLWRDLTLPQAQVIVAILVFFAHVIVAEVLAAAIAPAGGA